MWEGVGLFEVIIIGYRLDDETNGDVHDLIQSGKLSEAERTQIWDAVMLIDDTNGLRSGLQSENAVIFVQFHRTSFFGATGTSPPSPHCIITGKIRNGLLGAFRPSESGEE